ncbi:CHRD domain-containing protein [Sphingosinicella humi]|nr:CHRD domain-containing protein [Sphingosinicella humi]
MIRTMLPLALLLAAGPALAQEEGHKLTAALTGAAERPGPGDADGAGTAALQVNPGEARVCYTLKVSGIETATAAHIHKARSNESGPPVATLEAPADGASEGCASVTAELAKALIQTPAGFYVNVHNADFPAGAIRGQLGK